MEDIRLMVQTVNGLINISLETIAKEQEKIKFYQEEIERLQDQCDHEFKTLGTHGCHVRQCVKCGLTEGG